MSKAKREDEGKRRVFKVKVPVPNFTGVRFGIPLSEGAGITEDPKAAQAAAAAGYEVTDSETGESLADCFPRLAE